MQYSNSRLKIYPLFCIGEHQAFVRVAVAKMIFCCGKLKENKTKTVWQKWFYEIMFEGPQRGGAAMFLGCGHCKPSPLNVLQLSILYFIHQERGIPTFLENSMKKNQCLLHFQGFFEHSFAFW